VIAAAALATPLTAQTYVGWPDTSSTTSSGQNTFPMGSDTEWRFQYILPAVCFPAAQFKIIDMALAQGSIASTHPGVYQNFEVRMALTSLTALTTNLDANIGNCPVTVMKRSTFTWAYATQTWVDFGLDCAFAYDGVSSLVIEIRYTGGNTASLFVLAENPPGANRVYARGAGSYNASTASNMWTTSLPKTRFTVDGTCVLSCSPQVSLNATGGVQVMSANPGSPYQIATALGQSTKLTVAPGCSICIDPDGLFFLSVLGSPLFSGYSGTVSNTGTYGGKFAVLNIPALVGVCLSHASVTMQPWCCTNTAKTEIVP
jgi:hypothetical protein